MAFEGRAVRVRDLKGMHYIARLLAEPGREFQALDLVALESGGNVTFSELGDAGEMLDPQAKLAYRRRLVETEEDLEEARTLGDAARVTQVEVERDFLVRELSRAVGLGGRDRRAGSASERARASVTRAIRQALMRIREHDPPLGKHLEHAVRTGTFCAYRAGPAGALDLDAVTRGRARDRGNQTAYCVHDGGSARPPGGSTRKSLHRQSFRQLRGPTWKGAPQANPDLQR